MFSRAVVVRVALGAAAALGLGLLITSTIGSSSPTRTGSSSSTRSGSTEPTWTEPRPDVLVVGESLLHQVAPMETDLLRGAGHRPVVEARDSEDLASAFVQGEVHRAAAQGVPIVVLETAANDAYLGAGTAPPDQWAPALSRYRRTLAATLATLSHQCTVLVDTRVTGTSKWYELGRIGPDIDRALADAARNHPGAVEVVRWSDESASHGSDWFWADGLHFGDPAHSASSWHQAGASAFASAIAGGVARCSADLRARAVTANQ